MARVLVTEKIADRGLDALRAAGHEVDVQTGLSPEELLGVIPGAHALIIRSSTQVTAEVLAAGTDLVVVGRAGIGLDNVDTEAATARGVMVVNAPQSNILSTAEHTMGMLLAVARSVPQAHGALMAGRWERSKWVGVELADKTLGIVGLGRIGKLVAQRARAFGMNLVAYDPFVTAEAAAKIGIELLDLDALAATADFVTLHVVKTPDTIGMIGEDFFAKAKPGIRIVNVSRGGVIDEDALAAALADGRCGGAALDVFASEPTTESPLFAQPGFVGTPHLGASTAEAQDKAGDTIADMVGLALAGDFVPFAVNVSAGEASETVRPFLGVAEQLGGIFAGVMDGLPSVVDVEYAGELAGYDTGILTLSVLKGAFAGSTEEPVSYVNAPQVAAERGIEVRTTSTVTARDFVNLITISGGGHSVSGTLVGMKADPRLVGVDTHTVDVPPSPHMVFVRNDDRPGVIGRVGTILGDAGVNIADMDVGRSEETSNALMVIAVGESVPAEAVAALKAADGVLAVAVVDRT